MSVYFNDQTGALFFSPNSANFFYWSFISYFLTERRQSREPRYKPPGNIVQNRKSAGVRLSRSMLTFRNRVCGGPGQLQVEK